MRFDFRWPGGALTPEQKRAVAHRVNEMIRDDAHLVTRVLPLEEAKKTGAIWMAGEKYGERIRVVQAGPSVEFCGGTHSHSTGELGMFVILSESSIGSGIRRIESCVSRAAEEYVARQSDLIGTLSSALATSPDELGERVERMQRDVKDLQTALGQLRARLAAADARDVRRSSAERSGDRAFVGGVVREANAEALRHLSSAIRSRLHSGVVALAGIDDGTREPLGERQRRSRERRRARGELGEARGAARRGQGRRPSRAGAGRRKRCRRRGGGAARDSRRGLRVSAARRRLARSRSCALHRRGLLRRSIPSTCCSATRSRSPAVTSPKVVVYTYTVSQIGPSNIEQRHQIYRSGTDVRDETLSVDGIPLARKLVRFSRREDRYAVDRFAPRTVAYELLFLGTAKDGRISITSTKRRR